MQASRAPGTCFDREHLKKGIHQRCSVSKAPAKSAKAVAYTNGKRGGWRGRTQTAVCEETKETPRVRVVSLIVPAGGSTGLSEDYTLGVRRSLKIK